MTPAVVGRGFTALVSTITVLTLIGCGGTDRGEEESAGGPAPRIALSAPDATFPEALSSISGLRELPDGRVMVSDRLGKALMVVDFAVASADTIGRVGGGPGEYNLPAGLFPWRGDSTLLVDMGNTRFTPIAVDGGFGISQPLMRQDGEMMSLIMPEGTDRHGNVYYQARGLGLSPGGVSAGTEPDSALIVRWNLDTDQVDTVAKVRLPERKVQSGGGNVMVGTIPFSPSDDWASTWDGNVVVARAVGFRVEWRMFDGQAVSGPPVTDPPVTITQADKDAWLEERANPRGGGMFITVGAGPGGGGSVSAAPPPTSARFVGPQVDDADWPEVKPPFPPNAMSVTTDGEAWVRRHTALGQPAEYDVFDETGNRVRTVVLPDNSIVAGFGEGVVYVARTDEYDLQWLEKFRRP